MRASRRSVVAVLIAAGMLVVPLTASAGRDNRSRDGDRTSSKVAQATATFDYTETCDRSGTRPGRFRSTTSGRGRASSTPISRSGATPQYRAPTRAFRLIDIDDPDDPEEIIDWEDCASPTNTVGNQGDVIAWGRRGCAAARPDHPVVELADAGAAAELQQPRRPRDPGQRSAAASRSRARSAATGRCSACRERRPIRSTRRRRPRPGGRAHHRRQRSRGARGRRVSSTCRAGRTPRRWCPTCATTACWSTATRRRARSSAQPERGEEAGPLQRLRHRRGAARRARGRELHPVRVHGHARGGSRDLHPCHDTGVILGDVNRVACAGGSGTDGLEHRPGRRRIEGGPGVALPPRHSGPSSATRRPSAGTARC